MIGRAKSIVDDDTPRMVVLGSFTEVGATIFGKAAWSVSSWDLPTSASRCLLTGTGSHASFFLLIYFLYIWIHFILIKSTLHCPQLLLPPPIIMSFCILMISMYVFVFYMLNIYIKATQHLLVLLHTSVKIHTTTC